MAAKRCLEEDKTEKQLIRDSDSDCFAEDEADSAHDRFYKDKRVQQASSTTTTAIIITITNVIIIIIIIPTTAWQWGYE
jgi:hypothetical protein